MSPSRRKKSYSLRDRHIDPLLTYDGIKSNPLPYTDADLLPHDDQSVCLAELVYEQWDVNVTSEHISLREPFVYLDNDDEENVYLRNHLHPLNWLYGLIKNDQLQVHYSSKRCSLTLHYSFSSNLSLNIFAIYAYCKVNEKTSRFFKQLFVFEDYQSTSGSHQADTDAVNIIDFIYREIQAVTMLNAESTNSSLSVGSLLKNDVIQLKVHQIKSSACSMLSRGSPFSFLSRLVQWMLQRETDLASDTVYTPLHCCHDLSDQSFYVHIITGRPVHRSATSHYQSEQFALSGGILCDEMGLGKTMCVLLTALLNPCPESFLADNDLLLAINDDEDAPVAKRFRSNESFDLPCICGSAVKIPRGNSQAEEDPILTCTECSRAIHKRCFLQASDRQEAFVCPYCEQRTADHSQLLATSATLIVAPGAIIDQWIEEIYKHLDCPVKIYMYESIVNKVPVPDRRFLAEQDFIFCSYENLRKDIHHNEVCSKEHHSTRTQVRKYEYLISPLLRLKFWRLGSYTSIRLRSSFSDLCF